MQSGYFEGWQDQSHDSYCPEIASASNSPKRTTSSEKTLTFHSDELLPSACPRRPRPASVRRDVGFDDVPKPPKRTKRHGIVPYADDQVGEEAVSQLNMMLDNSMSNTEDLLAAMYNPAWDAASLQKWYSQSRKGPAELALFKIMFSLRYTTENPSPLPL